MSGRLRVGEREKPFAALARWIRPTCMESDMTQYARLQDIADKSAQLATFQRYLAEEPYASERKEMILDARLDGLIDNQECYLLLEQNGLL